MSDVAYQPTPEELDRRMKLLSVQTGEFDTEEDKSWYDYVNEVNTGLAHTMGLAVDVFAGPHATQRNMANLGLAHPPGDEGSDFTSRLLQGIGETLPFSLSMFGAGKGVDLGLKTGGAAAEQALAPMSRAALSYSRAPVSSAFRDILAVGGAVTGGILGEEASNNEPWGRALGEIVGGLSPTLAESLLQMRQQALTSVLGFWKSSDKRAAARIERMTGKDVGNLQKELDSNLLNLPPYIATGDQGLMAIQKSAMAEDAKLSQRMYEKEALSYEKAKNLLLKGTDPANVRTYFTYLINKHVAQIRKNMTKLSPKADPGEADTIVRSQLDQAYVQARATENAKWSRVADVPVETDPIKDQFQWILADRTPESDPADIPGYLQQFIGRYDGDGVWQGGTLTPQVKNVHELRSRILEDIRKEKAAPAPNRNKIRILTQVQESMLTSLASSRSASRYADALEFSSTLNNRFTKGFVGQLLGYERSGAMSYLPEETVQKLMKLSPERQVSSLRQILDASPTSRKHIADVVRQSFFAQATNEQGTLVRARAERFLQRNKGILSEFPDIKVGIEDSVREQRIVDSMLGERGPVAISPIKKRMSAVSLYLDANVGDELNRVMERSTAPREAMRELVRLVKNDKDAAAGLRTATKAWVLQKSSSGQLDTAGELIPSGSAMLKLIDKNRGALNTVLSQPEIARMQQIARELQKAEKFRQAGQASEGVIRDAPIKLLSVVARVLGARLGAKAAQGTAGGSIQSAAIGSQYAKEKLMSLTNDQAKEILLRAMEDESAMRTLLVDVGRSKYAEKKVVDTVISWLAVPTVTLSGQRDQEKDQLQQRMDMFRQMYDESGARIDTP